MTHQEDSAPLPVPIISFLFYNICMNPFPAYPCEEAIKLLNRHGISPTRQRIDIAQVLFAQHQHLSADQIQAQIDAHHTYASKATVYNTLKLFVEKGLVREVLVDPSKIFYDSNIEAHHHLYDVVSGKLTDIAADQVTVSRLPRLPEGMIAEGVDVVVRVRPAG